MFNFLPAIELLVKEIRATKDIDRRNELIQYAVLAEMKYNKDILEIIRRAGVKSIAQEYPKLLSQLSTSSTELLIASGTPAYVVFGDANSPKEENIENLSRIEIKWLDKKTSSEMYEFCVRKCLALKTLSNFEALSIKGIDLPKRLKYLEKAMLILIKRLS